MTIVVFCPNLIGDTVMATPTIRAIREQHRDARILGVIKPHVAATLAGTSWFDELIEFNAKSKRPDQRSVAVVKRIRRERANLAVLLPNSFRSAFMAFTSGIPRRVGYARGGRGLLLTDRLKAPRRPDGSYQPTPIVRYYAKLAEAIDCPVRSLRLELGTTDSERDRAYRALGELGLLGTDFVTMNTGGAFGPSKNWPEAHFGELAKMLASELGTRVLVVCGPGEREAARRIVELAAHPLVQGLHQQELSIGLTKECVRRSSLLVTTDSGPRHFAVAFQVPVITLFGSTHIDWTETEHDKATHLFHPVSCGPCQKAICPLGDHRCMQELAPESVFRAVERMLTMRLDIQSVA